MKTIYLLLISVSLCSCGAKQKTTYREREAAQVTRSETYDLQAQNNINSSVRITKMGVVPVDPTRTASYTDPKGNTHQLNNAKINFQTSEEDARDTSVLTISGQKNEEEEYNRQARETESQILRVPLPLTIGVGLALIAGIIFFVYRKTKK